MLDNTLKVNSGRVHELDGLRAFAALGVIIYHAGLLPFGWAGVWLFYVLSGYVITTSLGRHTWSLTWDNYQRFNLRRIARIWPLYVLFVAIASIAAAVFKDRANIGTAAGAPSSGELLSVATFTFNYYQMAEQVRSLSGTKVMEHLWTISVEQQFYLVFPLLLALATQRNPAWVFGSVIVAAIAVRIAFVAWMLHSGADPLETSTAVYLFAPAHFDAFAAGALLGIFRDHLRRPRVVAALWAAGCLTLGLYMAQILIDPDFFSSATRSLALRRYLGSHPSGPVAMVAIFSVAVPLSVAIVATAIRGTGRFCAVLRLPALAWLGEISYGLYVWHRIPGKIAESFVSLHAALWLRLVSLGGVVAVSIALAALSFYWFEQPVRRWLLPAPSTARQPVRV